EQSRIPEHEVASLDAAMSELTKQTEALLGKFNEERPQKPTLPKKDMHVSTRGKSFDIIQNPRKNTPLRATLKSVTKNDTKKIASPEVPLLPDHASKSYNELATSSSESETKTAHEQVSDS